MKETFSSFLTKNVLVWLSFRLENLEGFKRPFVLDLEGFEVFKGFERGFKAFVLTFVSSLRQPVPFNPNPNPPSVEYLFFVRFLSLL